MTRRSSKRRSSKRRSSKRPAPVRKNYTTPKRGWIMEREEDVDPETGELTLRGQVRKEMLDKLAAEWNELNAKVEARAFRSREERDEEGEAMYERAEDHAYEDMQKWMEEEGRDPESLWKLKRHQWSEEVQAKFQQLLDAELAKYKAGDDDTATRMSVVEELLGELGARMARPYEHWNEEEHLMEYAERDRGDYPDDY
jgi:stalled ribosome alternative rescue factor ArfA